MVEQKSVAKVAPLKTEVVKDISKSSLSRNDGALRTFKVDYDWIENTSQVFDDIYSGRTYYQASPHSAAKKTNRLTRRPANVSIQRGSQSRRM